MEENLKQRLVGAAVLVALAVIFLPALFDKDERVAIDTTSQIPAAPVIDPVVIPRPTKPEGINIPPAEELFQPAIIDEPAQKKSPTINSNDNPIVKDKPSSAIATDKKPQPEVKSKPEPKPEPKKVVVKPEIKPKPKAPSKPTLNASGLPLGWVVQAASFKSSKSAQAFTDKLLKANYKSYFKSVETSKGEYFRVLIGPYIDEQKAIDAKRAIDKAYKVSSRVVRFNPISGN